MYYYELFKYCTFTPKVLRCLAAANPAAPAPMTTTDSCNEIITLTAINEMYKKINHTLIYYLTKKFNYFHLY